MIIGSPIRPFCLAVKKHRSALHFQIYRDTHDRGAILGIT